MLFDVNSDFNFTLFSSHLLFKPQSLVSTERRGKRYEQCALQATGLNGQPKH